MTDPVGVLLSSARRVGDDYCWPAGTALEAIDALSSLSRAVLGVELWRFQDDATPEVAGWSDYVIDTGQPWADVVAKGAREAIEAILGHVGDRDLWVNISWADPPTDPLSQES